MPRRTTAGGADRWKRTRLHRSWEPRRWALRCSCSWAPEPSRRCSSLVGRWRSAVHRRRAVRDRDRVRSRRRGDGVLDRQDLGLSHQPGRDASRWRSPGGCRGARRCPTWSRSASAPRSAGSPSGACSPTRCTTPASATSPTPPTPRIGSAMLNEGLGTAILLFTILGIVDKRGGADLLAGLVIGLIVIGIIITVGAADRRRDQPRPLHRHPDHRPARRPEPGLGAGVGVLGRRRRRRPGRRARLRPPGHARGASPTAAPAGRTSPDGSVAEPAA